MTMKDKIEEYDGHYTVTRFGVFSLEEIVDKVLEMHLDTAKVFIGCADGGPSVVTWTVDSGD